MLVDTILGGTISVGMISVDIGYVDHPTQDGNRTDANSTDWNYPNVLVIADTARIYNAVMKRLRFINIHKFHNLRRYDHRRRKIYWFIFRWCTSDGNGTDENHTDEITPTFCEC